MKAEIKIPKGWRQLRRGWYKATGSDLWFDRSEMEWKPCQTAGAVGNGTYIRKIESRGRVTGGTDT